MSEITALFPGTFDPYTNGHLDLTRRAARLFDRVVVAVARSTAKGTLFPLDDRVEMIRYACRSLKRVEVVSFDDLVVDCATRVGAQVMIRGIRAVSDFEFEFQMALMNRRLSARIEVAFLMPSQQYTYLNSTLVKEVARLGGKIHGLVPRHVEEALRRKLREGAAGGRPAAAATNGAKPAARPATTAARAGGRPAVSPKAATKTARARAAKKPAR
jgi:pantetheine-phosphate adenylyltransferase